MLRSTRKRIEALEREQQLLYERMIDQEEKIALLQERFAIQHETDGPEEEPFAPAAAPGEAAEDFWEDDWPLNV